jgi:hypothetical protein
LKQSGREYIFEMPVIKHEIAYMIPSISACVAGGKRMVAFIWFNWPENVYEIFLHDAAISGKKGSIEPRHLRTGKTLLGNTSLGG